MRLLNTVDKPEIEILKLVYSDIQNNNFFKYNMGKQDVSYLTSNNSIDSIVSLTKDINLDNTLVNKLIENISSTIITGALTYLILCVI